MMELTTEQQVANDPFEGAAALLSRPLGTESWKGQAHGWARRQDAGGSMEWTISGEHRTKETPGCHLGKGRGSRSVLNTQGKHAGHPALPLPERSASRLEDRRCGSGVSASSGTWHGSTGAFSE